MLLQTFVQLNILLLAAPALAGWVMSPVAPPVLAQAAQIIFLPAVRQVEAPPLAEERDAPQPAPPASLPRRVLVARVPTPSLLPASPEAIVSPFAPFPHPTRAP